MADPLMVRSEGLKPAFFFFFFFSTMPRTRLPLPDDFDAEMAEKAARTAKRWFPTDVFNHWGRFLLSVSHVFFLFMFHFVVAFFFKFYLCMNQRGEHSERVRHFQNCHLVPNCFLLVFQEQKRNEIMKASLKIDVAEDELSSQSE